MKMLDLFCGRLGWSKAFLTKGWEVIGVDLVEPPDIPEGVEFKRCNVMELSPHDLSVDFICASPPCQEFSVHGMKNFYPKPKFPINGLILFNYTQSFCELSRVPYVIENVRAAQPFVGEAVNHCGPFYLWGSGVPTILPQNITKGRRLTKGGYKGQTTSRSDKGAAAIIATIAPELALCVADYAHRITEQKDELRRADRERWRYFR